MNLKQIIIKVFFLCDLYNNIRETNIINIDKKF